MLTIDNLKHMRGVAQYMYDKAEEYGLDKNEAYLTGFLHDIGKTQGKKCHAENSYFMLESIKVSNEIRIIISIHGYPDPLERYLKKHIDNKYGRLALLLNEADMMVNGKGHLVGFEKRLEDVGKRYGKESETYKNCMAVISIIQKYHTKHRLPEYG